MSAPRYCLWGGRRGSVQIGSVEDRRLQAFARLTAGVQRIGDHIGRAVMPAIQQTADAFAELGRTLSGEVR